MVVSWGMTKCHTFGDDRRTKTGLEKGKGTAALGFFKNTPAIRRDEGRSKRAKA